MAKRPIERITITPLLNAFTTAASTSLVPVNIGGTLGGSISILCNVACGTNVSGVTATAANYVQFTVLESTGATAAASAISGATLTLGAATAAQARGVISAILTVTSNVTTAVSISINGINYQSTITGVGTDGEVLARALASAINGAGTSVKLPHYTATPNFNTTGIILISPDDDLATGLTLITTAAASTIAPSMLSLQGVINLQLSKLSTNTPKYLSVSNTTFNGATSLISAYLVRSPSGNPSFPGRVVDVTT